mmetsp:Transcript_37940/g.70572  ORF Transcript_37940/g.70572 Transcript_37940/m.70572 type:complete len:740 (-) Transcript_37940:62-2281(-)
MAECLTSEASPKAILELLTGLSPDERQHVISRAEGGAALNETSAEAAAEDGGVGWTEIVVVSTGVFLTLQILGTVLQGFQGYRQIPPLRNRGFSDYLKYRFGVWYSKTTGAAEIVLFYMSAVLLIFGGISNSLMANSSLADSLWASWIWIVAPDGGDSGEGYFGRIAGLCTSCGGMLIFAALMSIISAKFEEMLDMFKNEGLPVIESGHIVVLGWSPMVPFLVDELCNSKEGSGGCAIVILTPLDKVDVEEKLEDAGIDYRNSDVVVRSGDRRKTESLEETDIKTASIVIVVSKADVTREDSDARQLNVLSAMRAKEWPTDGTVLVQSMLKINSKMLAQYCHSKKTEVVVTGDILGSLMVHCAQERGLAQATLQLLGFDGAEFYDVHVQGIAGKTFRDLVFGLPGAIPVGIVRGDDWVLLPDMDMKFSGDERIIMLADDETACPKKLDEERICSSFPSGVDNFLSLGVKRVVTETHATKACETVLIIGWNETIGAVLVELDKVLAQGSTVVIFSPQSISDRQEFLREALKRRGKDKYKNFDVKHCAGPLCARTPLSNLPLHAAARVFVLSDSSLSQPRDADANAIAVSIQLLSLSQEQDKEVGEAVDRVFVPQILLSNTEEHFKSMGLPDYILSDKLTASICAQIACNPEMRPVIEELVSDSGCSLSIRTLEQYPELAGQKSKDVTFEKIVKQAALTGELAIGFKLTMSAYEEWIINPKEWRAHLEWGMESRIVSLSRT